MTNKLKGFGYKKTRKTVFFCFFCEQLEDLAPPPLHLAFWQFPVFQFLHIKLKAHPETCQEKKYSVPLLEFYIIG